MGRVMTETALSDDGITIVAGVDADTTKHADYPVYSTLGECPQADVVIDFSVAKAVD